MVVGRIQGWGAVWCELGSLCFLGAVLPKTRDCGFVLWGHAGVPAP